MSFDLLPLSTHQNLANGEVLAVDLRGLHRALGSKQEFTNWTRSRLREAQADEGADYLVDKIIKQVPHQGGTRNREVTEFIVTVDLAKEIAMLERNEHGKRIRRYFIEAEKNYRKNATPPAVAAWLTAKLLEIMPAERLMRLLSVRHPYGTLARNGKPRTGWRRPAYVAARHREEDARAFQEGMVQLNLTVQLELPKLAEAVAAMEGRRP